MCTRAATAGSRPAFVYHPITNELCIAGEHSGRSKVFQYIDGANAE